MKKSVVVAIIVAAVAVPAIVYAASPLFINTTINEPVPVTETGDDQPGSMEDQDGGMIDKGDSMTEDEPAMADKEISGKFVGVGDGIHDASGLAKVIPIDGSSVLRLEDFRSTNGPDLYVYLSVDKEATDFVDLGRLKGNIGNQNYDIPEGTDLSKYDTVLVWCKQFSVLFGSAELAGNEAA
ncbi:MAG TPA: DM13 domain-containing protein [Nitrososphaera sp.]